MTIHARELVDPNPSAQLDAGGGGSTPESGAFSLGGFAHDGGGVRARAATPIATVRIQSAKPSTRL